VANAKWLLATRDFSNKLCTAAALWRNFNAFALAGKGGVHHGSDLHFDVLKSGVDKKDLILFGIGLHAFQDSWSHEGFSPIAGHGPALEFPDLPYLDDKSVKKAMQMAEETYKWLNAYRTKWYPDQTPPTTFKALMPSLLALMRRGGSSDARIQRWKDQIFDQFNTKVMYTENSDDPNFGKLISGLPQAHTKAASGVKAPFQR
jgi:hypothetical protein